MPAMPLNFERRKHFKTGVGFAPKMRVDLSTLQPRQLMTNDKPIAIDVFSGVGGMSLGFEQAGFDVRAAFDIEEWNVDTYSRNFPGSHAVRADVRNLNADVIREAAQIGDQTIDVVFGGPPCQGFSVGGTRDLKDERNLLIHEFARVVGDLAPTYFVMENVKGLLQKPSQPALDLFLESARAHGYEVLTPRVLNAADFNVPQKRERTFIIGYRRGAKTPAYPEPETPVGYGGRRYRPTVADALAGLPVLEEHDYLFEVDVYRGRVNEGSRYSKMLRCKINDPSDMSTAREVPSHALSGCLRTGHSVEIARRFAKTKPGTTEPISRYFRLSNDGMAPTIRAGTGRDHGSHTAPRPIHPTVPRCITTREAARLHSFPDWFQFYGTRWHGFRQIGNSVPPFLARAVARVIFKLI